MANSEKYNAHLQWLHTLPSRLQRYRVSLPELLFLVSFPINFIIGKTIHWCGPEEEVYNYYNNKNNVFNQVFVKRGWFWTTVVLVAFYGVIFTSPNHSYIQHAPYSHRMHLLRRTLVRYLVMTVWWVLFTQWCFGLPLMDKVFVYTGGKCANVPAAAVAGMEAFFTSTSSPTAAAAAAPAVYESNKITSYMCRRLQGTWQGGHDPSGHVFLLTHSSLYLFHEMLPYWDWSRARAAVTNFRSHNGLVRELVLALPHLVVALLIGLWWFMLLMTNIYFHSVGEKFVGLMFGFVAVAAVYYAPRWAAGGSASAQE